MAYDRNNAESEYLVVNSKLWPVTLLKELSQESLGLSNPKAMEGCGE